MRGLQGCCIQTLAPATLCAGTLASALDHARPASPLSRSRGAPAVTARATTIRTSEIKTRSPSVRSKWKKLAFFDDETRVGPRKKPTPRGRGGGALRAAKAEAQAEAPRAFIAICGKPYVEAVSVPLETDTAIYCAARQQAISTLLVFDICISNSMRHPVGFVVSSLEGRSHGSSSDSFHEGTNAFWLQ